VTTEVTAPPESADAEELAALRQAVREVSDAVGGTAAVRRLMGTTGDGAPGPTHDERAWNLLAGEIGLSGLGLPESAGGLGGLVELVTVAEELGRTLLPVPFLSSTVLTGQVLARAARLSDSSAADAALATVAAGDVVAPVLLDQDGAWDPHRPPVTAISTDSGWLVGGVAPYVLDGPAATALLVAAATGDGTALLLVDSRAEGVSLRPTPTLDLSRSMATVVLESARGDLLVAGGAASAAVLPALDTAAVVLAAEQLGGAQACLDMTVDYIKQRRQFGRPIGSFQAVKHLCADLLGLVEGMRSAVVRAVLVADAPDQLAEAACVAQTFCSEAFRTVSAETVQLHGGIGFSWEHDAHLYFRRARADAVLLGGPNQHRERLADLLGW